MYSTKEKIKVWAFVGAMLLIGVLAWFFAVGISEAQTAPDFIAQNVGPGEVEFFDTDPGDRSMTIFEVTGGAADAGITFWTGVTTKIKPRYGAAVTDTIIPIPAGATMTFTFPGYPKPAWAYVSGGDVTIKAE